MCCRFRCFFFLFRFTFLWFLISFCKHKTIQNFDSQTLLIMWHCHQNTNQWIQGRYFHFILSLIKGQLQVWYSQQIVQSNQCLLNTAHLTANLSRSSMSCYQWQNLIQTMSTQHNYRINRISRQSYAGMFSLFICQWFFNAKESLCSMETNTLLQTNLPYASFCSYHKPSEYVLNSKLKKKKISAIIAWNSIVNNTLLFRHNDM